MNQEAPLAKTEHGLVPSGEGWFVLNARDARWEHIPGADALCVFEGEPRFAQVGINLRFLPPGEPMAMYHWEADQEDFLVLSGEALLIVEGEERRLRPWDFVHCPPGTRHTIVGAGDGPCVVLAVGARDRTTGLDWGGYPVDETARRHGAGVDEETADPKEAYARFDPGISSRYRDGWLPDLDPRRGSSPSARVAIRPVRPAEHAAVGELVVEAYRTLGDDGDDESVLRDVAGRVADSGVLVAELDARIVGTVTFVDGQRALSEVDDPDAATIRMLGVAPEARGRGVGEALTVECIERARRSGRRRVRLDTRTSMTAAHRLYARLGFRRDPEHDWSPAPGIQLLAYVLELDPAVPADVTTATNFG